MILQAKSRTGQVVLLLGPRNRIGPLRLAVVGGKGMTSVAIPGFIGGRTTERDGDEVLTREEIPALVIDDAGRRALVVSGRRVAAISLRNLSVREHTLSEPVSLLERLHYWFEPSAHAKLVEGSWRTGAWVGEGRFALTGMDYSSTEATPAGFALVDTRDWNIRTVDQDGMDLVVTEDAVLTYRYDSGDGVKGYDLGGKRRFQLIRRAPVFQLQVVRGLVYAHLANGERVAAIDPVLGRTLGVAKTEQPIALVEG